MSTYTFPSLQGAGPFLILGLGATGVAAATWCLRAGIPPRLADTRADLHQAERLRALRALPGGASMDVHLGDAACAPEVLNDVRAVVISPGLNPHEDPVRGLLAQAQARGIKVIGEIELFARALIDLADQGYTPRVLAVTGTNGKTTVTAMTRHLLQASGIAARAAGNIGPAALTALADALDANDLPQVWVLELSSFQLHTTQSLKPDAAAVLNVTQDHLDWHGSLAAYAQSKARLLAGAALAVVNRDDPLVRAMVPALEAASVRSFGRECPDCEGDLGLARNHDVLWLAHAQAQDFAAPRAPARRHKQVPQTPPRAPGRVTRLMPVDALHVQGLHNALNAQAALLLACAGQADWAAMLHALREYRGEPHRMAFVRTAGGVDFIDDSKGTNVGATVAGLQGLGRPTVLIAGGLGKDQDFAPLAEAVRAHARAVVLIGRDAAAIAQVLGEGVNTVFADTLPAAVRQAHALAQPGDAVLLSPACASMDMFRDYTHRAQVFVAAIEALALDMGEVA